MWPFASDLRLMPRPGRTGVRRSYRLGLYIAPGWRNSIFGRPYYRRPGRRSRLYVIRRFL